MIGLDQGPGLGSAILDGPAQSVGDQRGGLCEDIARAAGVVRRTLYGHFANRQALVAALAEEARQALGDAFGRVRQPESDPAEAMARLTLAA
ncbi:TetR family transcriptional regulator [Actinomadura violacea]|uniref:TetR family transcriptional regulator n=1 Tax=Actinomadura violacea TaxID=2819934 RepID=UPI0027DBDB18|nr:TetR family transcriptional regulator [Actinomadura violacea]